MEGDVWVCPVCGYTHVGKEAPERYPICGLPREKFVRF
ncbi:MAG: rubredoxin-like domain-containing protein [Thermoprotei archaeon]